MEKLKHEIRIKKCPQCGGVYGQYDLALPLQKVKQNPNMHIVAITRDNIAMIQYICNHCRKDKTCPK